MDVGSVGAAECRCRPAITPPSATVVMVPMVVMVVMVPTVVAVLSLVH